MTTSNAPTNCLVFKLEEFYDYELDTTLFILYDKNEEMYLIRGKRSALTNETEGVSYSFRCKYVEELLEFIKLVICSDSLLNYTLYNYDNLPYDCDDITFDSLKDDDNDRDYEITGFDNQKYSDKKMKKFLRILKYVFNYY